MPGPSGRYRKDDTPDARYLHMMPVATRYSMVQIGLCLFHEVDTAAGFVASPYTWFLFPSSGPDLTLSVSAMEFLRWVSRRSIQHHSRL